MYRDYDTLQRYHIEEVKHRKNTTMKNVSYKKGWNLGATQVNMEPLPIPLLKGLYDGKPEEDFVKLKLRRDPL